MKALTDIITSLEEATAALKEMESPKEVVEAFDPYAAARDITPNNCNGWLQPAELQELKDRWLVYLEENQPLTRDMYKALPDEERRKIHHPIVWTYSGGVQIRSASQADRFYSELVQEYHQLARDRSKATRLANGWTERNGRMYDPQGRSRGPNGQSYGPYAGVTTTDVWGDR